MRSRPLLIATGFGAAVQILYLLAMTALTYFLVYPILEQSLLDDLQVPGSVPGPVINTSLFTGIAGICLAPVLYAAIGVVYTYFHHREYPVTPDQGAVGGAAAAAAARLLSGVIGVLINAIAIYSFSSRVPFFAGLGDGPPDALIFGIFSSAVGSLFGLCFGAVFAALIGALGGGLGALVINR